MASVQVEYVQNVVETRDLYLCVEILLLTRSTVILLKFPGESSSSLKEKRQCWLYWGRLTKIRKFSWEFFFLLLNLNQQLQS